MKTQRDTRLLPGVLTACLGSFLIWHGSAMPHPRGWSSSPGLFPIIIGVVLVILALLLLVERHQLRKAAAPAAPDEGQDGQSFKLIWLVPGSLAIYILALGYLPYEPPTFVFLALAMWAFGNRSIFTILFASLGFTLLISVIFTQVLGTLIPGTYSLLELLLY